MNISNILPLLFSALTSAGFLFLVAAGLTLIFGAMRIINVAHGSFYMLGAFVVSSVAGAWTGHVTLMFWVAIVVAPLLVALLGVVTEIVVLRPLYGREHLLQLLATFGLLFMFEGVTLNVWGGQYRSVTAPAALQGQFSAFGSAFPVYNFFIIGVAIAVGIFMWWLLQRTRLGWQIRAAVDDREMLAASGTNVSLLFTGIFTVGVLLASIAGAVVGPTQSITTGLGTQVLVEAFIVVVIGGLGSIPGAAIGAIIIGLFQAVGIMWAPSFASAFIFIAMILVLAIRPSGLMGTVTRVS